MDIKKTEEFADMEHSIHVFDTKGNRLADIDENGIRMHSDSVMISVCKKTGEDDGWPKYEMIYLPERLAELVKSKIEPCGPISCNNTDME